MCETEIHIKKTWMNEWLTELNTCFDRNFNHQTKKTKQTRYIIGLRKRMRWSSEKRKKNNEIKEIKIKKGDKKWKRRQKESRT